MKHPGGDSEARGEGAREVVWLHPRRAVVEVLRVAVRVVRLPVRRRRRRHAAGGAEQDPLLLAQDTPPQTPQPGARGRAGLAVVRGGGGVSAVDLVVPAGGGGGGVDVVVVVVVAVEIKASADESPAGEVGGAGAGGLALEARAVAAAAAAVHGEELEMRGGCGLVGDCRGAGLQEVWPPKLVARINGGWRMPEWRDQWARMRFWDLGERTLHKKTVC